MCNNKSLEIMGEVKVVLRPSAPSEYTLTNGSPVDNYRNFEYNGKLYQSLWPNKIELLTPEEQEELKDAPWFQVGLAREISLEILLQQPLGLFLVRQSESHKKCFALSMRVPPLEPPKLSHYLVEKTQRGYRFRGNPKEFKTLSSLVTHHSVLKEHLPIPLILPKAQESELNVQSSIIYETTPYNGTTEKSPSKTTSCFKRRSKEK